MNARDSWTEPIQLIVDGVSFEKNSLFGGSVSTIDVVHMDGHTV
jgi:hypothetical protein